jgi:hypothetical protein
MPRSLSQQIKDEIQAWRYGLMQYCLAIIYWTGEDPDA